MKSAEGSLAFALEQQQRAHTAANQAEADAAQASANADQAASYAAAAHQSANEAASSAASARASAVAAGKDADLAAAAADDAYRIAMEKWHAEQVEIQAANDLNEQAGEHPDQPAGMLEIIKEKIGKEALDLILDLIGVTDAINCFKGDITGCLWTTVNFLPVGKLLKGGKAIAAIRNLIGKVPEIRKALEARKIWIADKIEAARSIPACPIVWPDNPVLDNIQFNFTSRESTRSDLNPKQRVRFLFTKSTACTILSDSKRPFRGGNYYQLATWSILPIKRHHILASDVIKNNKEFLPPNLNRNNAPAIQMTAEDHRLTESWGRSNAAREYRAKQTRLVREGRVAEVFEMEEEFLKKNFPGKYDDALAEMKDYAYKMGLVPNAV